MSSESSDSNSPGSFNIGINIELVDYGNRHFQKYTLQVDSQVPVPELKRQIAALTKIPPEDQYLEYRARTVLDDAILSAYGIEDGHTLHLFVKRDISTSTYSAGIIGVQIEEVIWDLWNPSTDHSLRVDPYVSVFDLKTQIEAVTGILTGQQRLIYRGLVLPNHIPLSYTGIEDGSTIYLLRQQTPPSSENPTNRAVEDASRITMMRQLPSISERQILRLRDFYNISSDRAPIDASGLRQRRSNVRGTGNSYQTANASHASGRVREDSAAASVLHAMQGVATPEPSQGLWHNVGQAINDIWGWLPGNQTATESPTVSTESPTVSTGLHQPDSGGMQQQYQANGRGGNSSQTTGPRVRGSVQEDSDRHSRLPAGRGSPTSLTEIFHHVKDKLNEYAGGIGQLMGLLHDHVNLTDPVARRTIEVNAMQLHDLLKNFAIILLETSRTIMTIPMEYLPPRVFQNQRNSSRERSGIRGNTSGVQLGTHTPGSSSSSRQHMD